MAIQRRNPHYREGWIKITEKTIDKKHHIWYNGGVSKKGKEQ